MEIDSETEDTLAQARELLRQELEAVRDDEGNLAQDFTAKMAYNTQRSIQSLLTHLEEQREEGEK